MATFPFVEQFVAVMADDAEIAHEAGVVVVLNILQGGLGQAFAVMYGLGYIAHEAQLLPQRLRGTWGGVGDAFGRPQGTVLPSEVTVGRGDDLLRGLQLFGHLDKP